MARTKFELIYPRDGSRKQISCSERNSLLLAKPPQIKQLGPTSYKFIGQTKFHGFIGLAEWQRIRRMLPQPLSERDQQYLNDLRLIWLLDGEREWEFEQYPAAMEEQLDAMGFQPTPAGAAA